MAHTFCNYQHSKHIWPVDCTHPFPDTPWSSRWWPHRFPCSRWTATLSWSPLLSSRPPSWSLTTALSRTRPSPPTMLSSRPASTLSSCSSPSSSFRYSSSPTTCSSVIAGLGLEGFGLLCRTSIASLMPWSLSVDRCSPKDSYTVEPLRLFSTLLMSHSKVLSVIFNNNRSNNNNNSSNSGNTTIPKTSLAAFQTSEICSLSSTEDTNRVVRYLLKRIVTGLAAEFYGMHRRHREAYLVPCCAVLCSSLFKKPLWLFLHSKNKTWKWKYSLHQHLCPTSLSYWGPCLLVIFHHGTAGWEKNCQRNQQENRATVCFHADVFSTKKRGCWVSLVVHWLHCVHTICPVVSRE